jgi:hypothetical protein
MALPATDEDWRIDLSLRHDAELPELRALDDEYELRSPRMYMHPELMRELGDRVRQVVIAWPLMVTGALEERLDVEGFRLPGAESGDKDLWKVWQYNGLDEESQLAHIEALVMKRAYSVVGTNEIDRDIPIVTYESPLEMYADIDPRTRRVRAALRRWTDGGTIVRLPERYATLYLPNRTVFYEASNGSDYTETDRDEHGLGLPPVTPLLNRGRLSDRCGKSELTPILPLAHAANKLATDMMVAAEFVALPLRGIFGIGPEDLVDQKGNPLTAMQAILGRLLLLREADGAKQFEFPAADLTNFHDSIGQLARLVASVAGLPPDYMGLATDNPPSADSRRAGEVRLVKRAERRQRAFGGGHEGTCQMVKRFQDGDWDPKYRQLETIWRDASTPTVAQKSDATVKTHAERIITTRQAREDLGYTQGQIERMEAEQDAEDAKAATIFKLPTAADQVPTPGAPVPAVVPDVPAA